MRSQSLWELEVVMRFPVPETIMMIVIKMIVIKMCRVPDSVMTTYTGCEEAGARSDTDSGPHSGL